MTDLEFPSSEIIDLLERSAPWSLTLPGDVIQCPPRALREGRCYVMGFNPGVLETNNDQRTPMSLSETTQALIDAKASNEHPLTGWPRGWSNLTKLAEALRVEDWRHNLFVTNLFPDSSGGVSAWLRRHGGRQRHFEHVQQIWPLHQHFLSIVRPRFVIVHGQGARDSAFRYLWEYLVQKQQPTEDWNKTMAPTTQEDLSIKRFVLPTLDLGEGESLSDVTFIGIKHLSRSQSNLDVMVRGLIQE